ncbi:hypothetical protein GOODEAATRI_013566, partial [Goodea atripinnis]
ECGRPPLKEDRIVGGVDAAIGAWPWQVDIQLNGVNQQESMHYVNRIVIPSGYQDSSKGKDIALLQLSTPVVWSDYVQPVCLPESGTLFPAGMNCYVTGWGNIREDGKAC